MYIFSYVFKIYMGNILRMDVWFWVSVILFFTILYMRFAGQVRTAAQKQYHRGRQFAHDAQSYPSRAYKSLPAVRREAIYHFHDGTCIFHKHKTDVSVPQILDMANDERVGAVLHTILKQYAHNSLHSTHDERHDLVVWLQHVILPKLVDCQRMGLDAMCPVAVANLSQFLSDIHEAEMHRVQGRPWNTDRANIYI